MSMLKFGQWKNLLVEGDEFDPTLFKGAAAAGADKAVTGIDRLSSVGKTALGIVQLVTNSLASATTSEVNAVLALIRKELAKRSKSGSIGISADSHLPQ